MHLLTIHIESTDPVHTTAVRLPIPIPRKRNGNQQPGHRKNV